MADEIDMANDLMDSEISRALSKIRQNASQSLHSEIKECIECGEEIPKARKELGFKLCVSCAQESERRRSQYADDY